MSIDKFLDRVYIEDKYNCFDFVREVWQDLTGIDIGGLQTPKMDRRGLKGDWDYTAAKWVRIDAPKDPCVVLFMRARAIPHVGVYIRGKVLHLPKGSNVRFEDLSVASLGFTRLSYYT